MNSARQKAKGKNQKAKMQKCGFNIAPAFDPHNVSLLLPFASCLLPPRAQAHHTPYFAL
jgi:hypothetical protein